MFKIRVEYPSYEEEREIAERQIGGEEPDLKAVLHPDEIIALRHFIAKKIPLHKESEILKYSTRIVRETRPGPDCDEYIRDMVMYGASPRASIYLAKAARVYAFLSGSDIVLPEHIHKMAYPVLRHRVILTHEAESQGIDPDDVISKILEKVPILEADTSN